MQALASSEVLLFEDFRLDRRGGGLFRRDGNGAFVPVALGSRGLDILAVLIERAGEVVSKDEIVAAVWSGTVVEDSNLTVQISALRRVLDQGRSNGSFIQTVVGRGYRFAAEVHRLLAENPSDAWICGDATGFAIAETSHSAPVVPERGLAGGLPAAVISDGQQGPDRMSDPAITWPWCYCDADSGETKKESASRCSTPAGSVETLAVLRGDGLRVSVHPPDVSARP